MRVIVKVRDTEKNVRATRSSVFTLRRVHDIRESLYAKSVKKSYVALKDSVAITLSTNFDLAIECLGVRVATIVVKMMKRKFATSEFSNFGCAIPGLLAMFHRMVFAVLSRFSEHGSSVVHVLVEDL